MCHKKSRCVPATLANAVSLMEEERSINLFQLTLLTSAPKRNILYIIGSKILSDLALVAAVIHCHVDEA